MKYFLIIDAGTSSVRAILFDTNGVLIDVSQQTWEHISIDGVSNSMGFDFEKNWDLITRCIKNVIKSSAIDSKSIVAISATSMREGIVLFDKNGNPIWAVANIDARASVEIAQIEQNYENVEKEFYDISGQTFALGALPRLLWLKNNSREIYDRVD
jgi:autoinducer 2 (AI-2) kinase